MTACIWWRCGSCTSGAGSLWEPPAVAAGAARGTESGAPCHGPGDAPGRTGGPKLAYGQGGPPSTRRLRGAPEKRHAHPRSSVRDIIPLAVQTAAEHGNDSRPGSTATTHDQRPCDEVWPMNTDGGYPGCPFLTVTGYSYIDPVHDAWQRRARGPPVSATQAVHRRARNRGWIPRY